MTNYGLYNAIVQTGVKRKDLSISKRTNVLLHSFVSSTSFWHRRDNCNPRTQQVFFDRVACQEKLARLYSAAVEFFSLSKLDFETTVCFSSNTTGEKCDENWLIRIQIGKGVNNKKSGHRRIFLPAVHTSKSICLKADTPAFHQIDSAKKNLTKWSVHTGTFHLTKKM